LSVMKRLLCLLCKFIWVHFTTSPLGAKNP
jgi:hypothetical protein